MQRLDLGDGAYLFFSADWLTPADADRYLVELRRTVAWEQGELQWFGKTVPEPRLTAWFGDADYTYSGRTIRALPWPELLSELRERVERSTGYRFNSVLLNLYRGGRDSMGLHSDDEPELGSNPTIASVSLGATRRFILKPKRGHHLTNHSLELIHGSLLLMAGSTQHVFRHGVPKTALAVGERINLTFRSVHGKP